MIFNNFFDCGSFMIMAYFCKNLWTFNANTHMSVATGLLYSFFRYDTLFTWHNKLPATYAGIFTK